MTGPKTEAGVSVLRRWGSQVHWTLRPRYFVAVSRRLGFAYFLVPKVATRSLLTALSRCDPDLERYDNVAFRRRELSGLRTFAFVRDPWTRLASRWANKISDAELLSRFHPELAGTDFEAFVRAISGWDLRTCDAHLRLQDRLVPRDTHFVGKLDRFDHDVARLAAWLDVPLGEIPHRNSSSRSSIADIYTPELRATVGRLYRRDVERFQYGGRRRE